MTLDKDAISSHMLRLGLGALAHATHHAMYYSMDNDKWSELSVLQAAHAAEILVKARIAQEHPLLIFDKLPKNVASQEFLDVDQLYEQGRTVQYNALPDQLWATTGLTIPNRQAFDEFGKIRNSIQHFIPKEGVAYGTLALKFIYDVIDPFINECWELYAVNHYEDIDGAPYLIAALISSGIYFKVSPDIAGDWKWAELEWPAGDHEYKTEMEKRISEALIVSDKAST